MRLRLLIVPTAQRHIRAAKQWWSKNRPAAPDLLSTELEKAFDLITAQPHTEGSQLRPVLPVECEGIGDPEVQKEGTGIRARWRMRCPGGLT